MLLNPGGSVKGRLSPRAKLPERWSVQLDPFILSYPEAAVEH
jgi:hypothetical protein